MFDKTICFICRESFRRPLIWIAAALILSIPAIRQIHRVKLDTSPVRFLPTNSRAAKLTRELDRAVGERSFFYILFKGGDQEKLKEAVETAASTIAELKGIKSIEYRYPLDFFQKYRYLLIPSEYLGLILETFIRWESELSPLGADILGEEKQTESWGESENKRYIMQIMDRYGSLPEYHQSRDGLIMGMIVRPEWGLRDIAEAQRLFSELKGVTLQISSEYGIGSGVGGALSRWVTGYNVIISDIKRSGMIMIIGTILVLFLGYRSLKIIPVLLFPLTLGLVWAVGLIPILVGDLNTITSFLVVISFGYGIDFSIHLSKRFQRELGSHSPLMALQQTFSGAGRSALVSGLTTALTLFVLMISDFRGISEFGLVGGTALIMIILAMILFMPATMVLGLKWGLIKQSQSSPKKAFIPRSFWTLLMLAGVIAAFVLAGMYSRFDYDFSKLGPTIAEPKEITESQDRVYPTSIAPSALYVAKDLMALDQLQAQLKKIKESNANTAIGWVHSLRDFCPGDEETQRRREIIGEIKEQIKGRWISRLKDPERKKWIMDLSEWQPPFHQPVLSELPEGFKRDLITEESPGRFIVALYPNRDPRHGKNAMAFTQELYSLKAPEEVEGPIGETPVYAEILWLVVSQGPKIVLLALLAVFLLVLMDQRSLSQTGWMMVPLISGIGITFGFMVLLNFKLNLFNMVVLPVLLGMGVDNGVHFFRRWKEKEGHTGETQKEFLNPLTLTTATTILGYGGLTLAHHPGLQSIGLLACLGLASNWATSLFLLPGLLDLSSRRAIQKKRP